MIVRRKVSLISKQLHSPFTFFIAEVPLISCKSRSSILTKTSVHETYVQYDKHCHSFCSPVPLGEVSGRNELCPTVRLIVMFKKGHLLKINTLELLV